MKLVAGLRDGCLEQGQQVVKVNVDQAGNARAILRHPDNPAGKRYFGAAAGDLDSAGEVLFFFA